MSKELECLDRIDKRNYLTEREHKEFLGVVEKAIKEYEAIKNAESSEALECLETIWCDISTNYINEYVAIKQALQRLESIDNANPSEALECLDGIEYVADVLKVNHKIGSRDIANQEIKEMAERLYYRIPTIKQALLKAEQDKKKARCWEITVKKNVDMLLIKKYDNVSDYNSAVWLSGRDKLTEEEFNLLKEGIKEC